MPKKDQMIRPSSISENLLFSTVRIEATNTKNEISIGTAFFYNHYVSDKEFAPFIVTNKHVIADCTAGFFRVHSGMKIENEVVPSGDIIKVQIEDFQNQWHFHPDREVDLCAMAAGNIWKLSELHNTPLFVRPISNKYIKDQSYLGENLRAIEDIVMIGYPIGLSDQIHNLPIIRKGITASHPSVDFNGRKKFLVDIACFPGSSGSPILILNEGSYMSKTKHVIGSSRVIFLGVLSSGPVIDSEGRIEIESQPTTRLYTITQQMIHLGIVEKSSEVSSLASNIIEKIGR